MDVLYFPLKHVHLNPGTHCFGSPHHELRVSGGACVRNNNPEGVTFMIHQETSTTTTTTITTARPLDTNNYTSSGWRDFGHVILGGAVLLAALGVIWGWKKHGAVVSAPARRLLAMVSSIHILAHCSFFDLFSCHHLFVLQKSTHTRRNLISHFLIFFFQKFQRMEDVEEGHEESKVEMETVDLS
jgi:hypothetical protein